MGISSFIGVSQFKSPWRTIAAVLIRSRQTQRERVAQKSMEIRQLEEAVQKHSQVITKLQQQLAQQKLQVAQLRAENQKLLQQPPVLPHDPRLPHHEFGPKMISMCVNLAAKVGLRASITSLEIVRDWLNIDVKLPDWTTVRTWMMRVGVAAIEEPIEQADDWVWLADHSNQIGQEKALVILGLRASNMPEPGVALTHQDVRLLSLEPGVSWKRDDMSRAYEQLAAKAGPPLALLVDGAVELREGADGLEKHGKNVTLLGDFKHFAANVLKQVVGENERFAEFLSQVGSTRSTVQQTELGHLTPPAARPKARFMNLAPTLNWAEMILWHLAHPHSKARREISAARMNDKLGWLRKFRDNIGRWSECQNVVSSSVTFINEQGLFQGAANRLASLLQSVHTCADGKAVADQLVAFVRESEGKLREGQRLPMSTEILESCFGLYKQLERQHSKGGFTSLLAAFGALLKPTTADSIRRDFARVSVRDMRTWVTNNLKTTLASKRKSAYAEAAVAA